MSARTQQLRADIAAAALPLFLARPGASVPLREVAAAMGVDFFVVYRQFPDRDRLYEAAVTPLVEGIAARAAAAPRKPRSVGDAVTGQLRHIAELFQTRAYRELLYLVMRDGALQPWLEEAYRNSVATPLERNLEAAVRRGGEALGLTVGIHPGTAARVLRQLEAALVAPALLPGAEAVLPADVEAARDMAAKRLVAATYALDLTEPVAA